MTRLYNHTRYSDSCLRDVLNFAARVAGVAGDVPVKVTYCVRLKGSGMAHNAWPYLKTLKGKPTTSADKRTLGCPPGWVQIRLPRSVSGRHPNTAHPAIVAAEWFVDLAIHEMAHVAQYRSGYRSDNYFGFRGQGRRANHDQRPCELEADNTVDEVRNNRQRDARRQEFVIVLAIELETS